MSLAAVSKVLIAATRPARFSREKETSIKPQMKPDRARDRRQVAAFAQQVEIGDLYLP